MGCTGQTWSNIASLKTGHYSPVVLTQLSYLMLDPGQEASHEADQLNYVVSSRGVWLG